MFLNVVFQSQKRETDNSIQEIIIRYEVVS